MRMVLVEWEDAAVCDAGPWIDLATAAPVKPVKFLQMGFLIALNDKEIVLTHAVGTELVASRERIPIGMVHSIFELVSGEPIPIPKRKRKRS